MIAEPETATVDPPEAAPVVVIGGGIIGVSTLYHLAQMGFADAVLVERKQLASGTTWHAAGIVGQLRESAAQTELAKYTARLFQTLEDQTGQATGYKQNGTINIALTDVRLEQLKRTHSHAARVGVEAHMLSDDALAGHWPQLNRDGVRGALYVPSNGQVNALDATQAFAKGARRNGARIFQHTSVLRLCTRNGRVTGVETDRGTIATGKVVLAGGMWTHRFAKAHGVPVPLHAAEHFYIVTETLPGLSPRAPALVVQEERSYWKEDAGKLLIGGFEARGKAWPAADIPDDFEFDEIQFDMDHVEPLLADAFARMPVLETLGIQTFFCGPESFTPDGRAYLGPAPDLDGLYVAAGMNSNGILMSGGVGRVMAGWLKDGMPEKSMASLHLQRAMPFQANERYLRERVVESIGMHMTVHWPGHQVRTARGVRRLPLHDRLSGAGAVFGERVGWETPMYFGEPGGDWPTTPSLGWQEWFPHVEAECVAARDAAVLVDQSMYAKIVVQGPDAVHALNRVSGADIDVPNGTSVYTQFLNARGGIEADVTVTRLSARTFLVLTGHPSQVRDQSYIKSHADPDWRFEIFDATSGMGLLTLHGPSSRAIVAALSPDDLSTAAFPFGAAREIDVAYARVWAIRRSFFGELGYELLFPTEFAAGLYEALIEEGSPHGLRHAGLFAMNHCRMEKAFRHFGHDIAEQDTPLEAGLGFAVDWDKPGRSVGHEALEAQRGQAPATRRRTVAIALRDATVTEGPFLLHNEPVWLEDTIVGHVTSGAWGFRIGRSLGLATLENPDGVSRDWLDANRFDVDVAGVRHPIDVRLRPFYDANGERMRA